MFRIETRYVLLLFCSLLIVAWPYLTMTFFKRYHKQIFSCQLAARSFCFSKRVEAFFMGKNAQDLQAIKRQAIWVAEKVDDNQHEFKEKEQQLREKDLQLEKAQKIWRN
jgi:sensor histidine kinase YesM